MCGVGVAAHSATTQLAALHLRTAACTTETVVFYDASVDFSRVSHDTKFGNSYDGNSAGNSSASPPESLGSAQRIRRLMRCALRGTWLALSTNRRRAHRRRPQAPRPSLAKHNPQGLCFLRRAGSAPRAVARSTADHNMRLAPYRRRRRRALHLPPAGDTVLGCEDVHALCDDVRRVRRRSAPLRLPTSQLRVGFGTSNDVVLARALHPCSSHGYVLTTASMPH